MFWMKLIYFYEKQLIFTARRHDTQHNDNQHNYIQHTDTQFDCKKDISLLNKKIMLSVSI